MAQDIDIAEPVHIDIRIDGETHSVDLAAGVNSVHNEIAELLIAQGLGTEVLKDEKPARKPKKTETVDAVDESIDPENTGE